MRVAVGARGIIPRKALEEEHERREEERPKKKKDALIHPQKQLPEGVWPRSELFRHAKRRRNSVGWLVFASSAASCEFRRVCLIHTRYRRCSLHENFARQLLSAATIKLPETAEVYLSLGRLLRRLLSRPEVLTVQVKACK